MATFLVFTVILTCFSAITATYYDKDHYRHKPSPLADDEPIVLHANRPLLITRTIQELPEEKVRPLIRIFVPRPNSKILKLHELQNLEQVKARNVYPHYGYIQPPKALPVPRKRIILTEPIVLDHGYGGLHSELLHDEGVISGLNGPPTKVHLQPSISHLPHLYPTLLHPLPQKYPFISHEKQILRPLVQMHPFPLKGGKPGY